MFMSVEFAVFCALLGVGLSMDACASAVAIGLENPFLQKKHTLFVAMVFGGFQALFELAGFAMFASFAERIKYVLPIAGFVILCVLGVQMIFEGAKHQDEKTKSFSTSMVVLQGMATSVDAFSAGVTIANHTIFEGLTSCLFTGVATFFLCLFATIIGKKFGKKFGFWAKIFGGIVLVLIGTLHLIKGFV